ncbi:MAG: sigma factor G inhibitor Gin [Clostridia bacterium]|jgi:hypothetical protein|nr:sigma factor G inhibitor Gin [Clostridia bacterium]
MNRPAVNNRLYNGKDHKTERKVLPVCFLCHEVPSDGIRSGFFLRGIFICSKCEEDLIHSQPEQHEKYQLTIAKLRKILFKK